MHVNLYITSLSEQLFHLTVLQHMMEPESVDSGSLVALLTAKDQILAMKDETIDTLNATITSYENKSSLLSQKAHLLYQLLYNPETKHSNTERCIKDLELDLGLERTKKQLTERDSAIQRLKNEIAREQLQAHQRDRNAPESHHSPRSSSPTYPIPGSVPLSNDREVSTRVESSERVSMDEQPLGYL